jgi:UDP-N-acetyl-D-mannosaminuronic acid dehydrogenase
VNSDRFSTVAVVGLGYIGLPTAAVLAAHGAKVIGIDRDPRVVEAVNAGKVHIIEPNLDTAVAHAVAAGALRATTAPEPADAFVIAVPTPFRGPEREPDLSFVESAARAVASVLEPGNLVVLESTCPVGATEAMVRWLAQERPDLRFPQPGGDPGDVAIAYCPERVLPGKVMTELIANDRVIGGVTPSCSEAAEMLYARFLQGAAIRASSPGAAELTKLTENSFRDVNIAFANELSMVCDRLGLNVWELIALANRHPRVNILQPGPGVGGHCIAVDPWFIVSSAPQEARLIATARGVNDSKPHWVLNKVREAVAFRVEEGQREEDIALACYGLAFKPDIDDLRESPALEIASALAATHKGPVIAVEPNIGALPESLEDARLVPFEEALTGDGIHLLLVDHREFRDRPPPRGTILDMRGIWTA